MSARLTRGAGERTMAELLEHARRAADACPTLAPRLERK
jgi:ferredoxin